MSGREYQVGDKFTVIHQFSEKMPESSIWQIYGISSETGNYVLVRVNKSNGRLMTNSPRFVETVPTDILDAMVQGEYLSKEFWQRWN